MSPRTRLLAVVVVVGIAGPARPEESQPAHVPGPADAAAYLRRIRAARRTGAIVLDGRMDEQAWEAAPWGDRFTQIEPDEAVPGSVQTRFRVLWDDDAIYIGVECKDPQPPTARLSRRDRWIEADYVSIDLDTTYDRRTAYHFMVYAAGQQLDGLHFNDTDFTSDWDGAWESSVARTAEGWSVELRIPLRLLRIPDGVREIGFNVYRHLTRRHEEDQWRYRPRGTPGDVSQLGILEGLAGLKPVRSLELRPFLAARSTLTTPAPASVRAPGQLLGGCASAGLSASIVSAACAGLDLKYNLASDLSLVATVNPDFGQVEADARVLNLTTFETFFPEKRPFFLEGLDLFKSPLRVPFGWTYGGLTYQLFYSRRVGRPPSDPDLASGEALLYKPSAQPVATALKLTGTVGGASVGLLSAVEPKVYAQVLGADGKVRDALSADAVNSAALRVRAPIGDRALVGFTGTAQDPMFSGTARHAHVGSADFTTFDAERDWSFTSQLVGSVLTHGQSEVIRDGTSIGPGSAGYAASGILRKDGGSFTGALLIDYLSPRFTTNDLGFMPRANLARAFAYVGYNDLHPSGWRQRFSVNAAVREVRNAPLDLVLYRSVGPEVSILFNNYWATGGDLIYEGRAADDRELGDGTPLEKQPALVGIVWANTDSRKPIDLSTTIIHRRERGRLAFYTEWDFALGFRPLPQLEGGLEGVWSAESGTMRKIRAATAPPGGGEDPSVLLDPLAAVNRTREYLIAPLRAQSLSTTLRATFAFSPRLSLQAYAQLFTAGIAYGGPQRAIVGPGKSTVTLPSLEGATAPDAAPNTDDRQVGLNLNLILRWEWRLGSTFYLVYARQTSNEVTPSIRGLSFSRDLGALSAAQGAVSGDTILVKIDLFRAL
jgi:Domain of unknown function (DUF5916)/Carbohydrate family 9 binding domain-like